MPGDLWLLRHGETEWSLSGAHTSRTDLPLTQQGEKRAADLKRILAGHSFALVMSSPMRRALDTCHLAGFENPEISDDLKEWDYGEYEGLTTNQIQQTAPGWTIFTGVVPSGESIDQVAARADRAIAHAVAAGGDVALFAHGHILRVLGARWVGLPPVDGKCLALSTGSISVLGYERETRVIKSWNQTSG